VAKAETRNVGFELAKVCLISKGLKMFPAKTCKDVGMAPTIIEKPTSGINQETTQVHIRQL